MPPKMTIVVGWIGSRSSPSTSGFSCSATAIGYSACGCFWATASWACTACPPNWLRSAALTLAAKAFCPRDEKRSYSDVRDHRHRDALGDRVLDRPAALAGVLDPRLEPGEVVALLLERQRRQLAQPRAHDRALHPEVGDLRVVELVLARVEEREALGVGLHDPVLDAVVDHLHVVPGAGRAEVAPARAVLLGRGRREHVEDRGQPLDGLVVAADHHAVARPRGPRRRRSRPRRRSAAPSRAAPPGGACRRDQRELPPSMIVSPSLEQPGQRLDGLLGRVAGRHHDPDGARRVELRDQVLQRRRHPWRRCPRPR